FFFFFLLSVRPPPTSTLFPYTTLFRSELTGEAEGSGGTIEREAVVEAQTPVQFYEAAGLQAEDAGVVLQGGVSRYVLEILLERDRQVDRQVHDAGTNLDADVETRPPRLTVDVPQARHAYGYARRQCERQRRYQGPKLPSTLHAQRRRAPAGAVGGPRAAPMCLKRTACASS